MPNWCDNVLRITWDNSNAEQVEFIKGLRERWKTSKQLLNSIKPQPKDLKEEDERNWNIDNWGTKWDVDIAEGDLSFDGDNTIELNFFQTAWSPCDSAMSALSDNGIAWELFFVEGGAGFYGYADNNGSHYADIEIDSEEVDVREYGDVEEWFIEDAKKRWGDIGEEVVLRTGIAGWFHDEGYDYESEGGFKGKAKA